MKFEFDSGQEHQLRAIDALLGLFAGQARRGADMRVVGGDDQLIPTAPVVANGLDLDDDRLLANLRAVQQKCGESSGAGIELDESLRKIPADGRALADGQEAAFPNFSVEMETGTGKTYVFLRAMRELAREFGFLKFVVVVPSVAVRENILHSLAATNTHLEAHCGQSLEWARYDSANLARVRDYAAAESPRVLVMTMASFNKALNVIHRDADELAGDTPLRLIQATRPILILDEPQNMESGLSQDSLAGLNPLFALRFSATHRDAYNQVFRLTPADAYRRGLVKKIQVATIRADDQDAPLVRLDKVTRDNNGILRAHLALNVHTAQGDVQEKVKRLRLDDSLGDAARLPVYEGLHVDDIGYNPPWVLLSDGRQLQLGEEVGGAGEEIVRAQMEATIREHFRRQRRLRGRGVKVLSLFFIDRVDRYRDEDGDIRRMFEELFDRLKEREPEWCDMPAAEVHGGYFAVSRKGDSERDVKAYDLIMRDKESLLSFAGPHDDAETRDKRRVAFIFSHSALREGWDNPNIMQICALRRGGSTMRRRQEVGRGLRLCVNQRGERVADGDVNLLTVVAREDFADYARGYQLEIAEEYRAMIEARCGKRMEDLTEGERARLADIHGEGIIPPLPRCADRRTARATRLIRGADGEVQFSPEFMELWERIRQKTTYNVQIDSDELVANTVRRLQQEQAARPQVEMVVGKFRLDDDGAFAAAQASGVRTMAALERRRPMPNVVELVLRLLRNGNPPLHLTRRTVFAIIRRAANDSVLRNPTGWAAMAAQAIRREMEDLATDGVEYRRIENQFYDWEQWFVDDEREIASALVADLRDCRHKAPYNLVECDSATEKQFAEDLREREDVKLFLKLPRKFLVPTPVGNYNPDWAILMTDANGRDHLYFVAETKGAITAGGAIQWSDLRGSEQGKIRCAARHFGSKQLHQKGALDGTDYQVVHKAADLRKRD